MGDPDLLLISSLSNPRVKHIVALNDKKQRDADGLMLIEGFDPLSMALECGVPVQTVLFCPPLYKPAHNAGAHAKLMQRVRANVPELIETTQPVFEKMAYRDGPDGFLAIAPRPRFELGALAPNSAQAPLLLVAERVEKPGNLGAMLRTCDAAGVDAFITVDPVADFTNPNVVRASQGTLFSLPVAQCTRQQLCGWLKQHGIRSVATTPNAIGGKAPLPYTAFDFKQPCAILMGEEKYGLSDFWLKNADATVKIPMFGRINSLNVATSAALVIYEAVRQRHQNSS
jgi:RNA methyltransferase, TrmH family